MTYRRRPTAVDLTSSNVNSMSLKVELSQEQGRY